MFVCCSEAAHVSSVRLSSEGKKAGASLGKPRKGSSGKSRMALSGWPKPPTNASLLALNALALSLSALPSLCTVPLFTSRNSQARDSSSGLLVFEREMEGASIRIFFKAQDHILQPFTAHRPQRMKTCAGV